MICVIIHHSQLLLLGKRGLSNMGKSIWRIQSVLQVTCISVQFLILNIYYMSGHTNEQEMTWLNNIKWLLSKSLCPDCFHYQKENVISILIIVIWSVHTIVIVVTHCLSSLPAREYNMNNKWIEKLNWSLYQATDPISNVWVKHRL